MVKILNDRFGIQVRGGCSCAGTYGHYLLNINKEISKSITDQINQKNLSVKPGWVRISIHPIMTDSEVMYITDAIKQTIKNIKQWETDYIYVPETNEYKNMYANNKENDTSHWFKFTDI